MEAIIVDFEWNQPLYGGGARKKLPFPLEGEIIQIGAVRMSSKNRMVDSCRLTVRPRCYRKLNRIVKKLTGMTQGQIDSGLPFAEAVDTLHAWCGGDCIFLTWGPDDKRIFAQNLMLNRAEAPWIQKWVNLQLIYNAQTDTGTMQKSLSTAMLHFNIPEKERAHDAMNDALYTARVCERLDLKKGLATYEEPIPKPKKKANASGEIPCVRP